MDDLAKAKAHSAALVLRAWPLIAPELGCRPELEPASPETESSRLATFMDARTGVDYFTCRVLSGASVPISTRTHDATAAGVSYRSYCGVTQRYRRAGSECEHFRLAQALNEPFGQAPAVHAELYFEDGGWRVYVARVSDITRWCLKQRMAHDDATLLAKHLLRRNGSDGALFFAPSPSNLRASGAPVWEGRWAPAPADLLRSSAGLEMEKSAGDARSLWHRA